MKSQTHNVRIPPVTDVPQMIGAYAALISVLGIPLPADFPFALAGAFSHPIEAENQAMTADFMNTKMLIESLRMRYVNVALAKMNVNGSQLVMTFTFTDPTQPG